ncbi:MAG: hypothetical protein SGI72_04975 [Planctomycetota bacterium]|nr:hypothetical protein [Planctomycetota bacterium]
MTVVGGLGTTAKTFLLSTFTELSFWRRWLVRIAVVALIVGIASYVIALTNGGDASPWSSSGLRSGGGFLLGFAAGALVRVFLKVGFFIAIVAGGAAWGMSQWGWIALPYESLADVQAAFGVKAQESASWLDSFFKSHLPQSAATAVGGFSGVTQKPRFTPASKND